MQAFLKGEVSYTLPKQSGLQFCGYDELTAKDKKKLSSFFSGNKIPGRIRRIFPFVIEEKGLIDPFYLFGLKEKTNENNETLTNEEVVNEEVVNDALEAPVEEAPAEEAPAEEAPAEEAPAEDSEKKEDK